MGKPKQGTRGNPYDFESAKDGWSEAFRLCRDLDRPIVINIDGHEAGLWKIFPSGHGEILRQAAA